MSIKLKTAHDHYQAGHFTEAEHCFLEKLATDSASNIDLMRLGELALWQNKLTDAEQYLQKALANLSWLEKLTMGITLKSLLAMLYYRQDDFLQASHYFLDAGGFLPLSAFNDLKALGKHLALFNGETSYLLEGNPTTSIPFVRTDPLPIVEMSINDSDPMLFLIDTGGAELILDTDTAQSFGVEFVAHLSGSGGGSKGQIVLGKIDRLQLGEIIIKNVPIHSMDTQHMAVSFDHLPIKGIIGTRLLMHFLTTIDYPNACLTLQAKTATVSFQKEIPFYLVQSHYILAQGQINQSDPMLLFVDTGLGGQGFAVDQRTLVPLNTSVDWSQAEASVVGFGDTPTAPITAKKLTLGTGDNQLSATDLSGIVFKKPFDVLGHNLGFYVGGVVSHLFFRDYALSLDFVGMRLLLN